MIYIIDGMRRVPAPHDQVCDFSIGQRVRFRRRIMDYEVPKKIGFDLNDFIITAIELHPSGYSICTGCEKQGYWVNFLNAKPVIELQVS